MALVELDMRPGPSPLPPAVTAFLGEADRRIEAFVESHLRDPITGFVPCDFPDVYVVLREIAARNLAPGEMFCEWGSGFGIVAMLAAMLEFHACGIEIEGELVLAARALAADQDLPVEFVEGSFLPEGSDGVTDRTTEFAWLRTDGACGYDELGLDIGDFDVVFAYPWPGEEEVLLEIFDHYAASGALLVTYQGVEDVRVRRKVERRRR